MKQFRFRFRHAVGLLAITILALSSLWILLAYTALPRVWLHHERHKARNAAITAYTVQNIPGDPINLHVTGDEAGLECMLAKAGWTKAAPVNLGTSFKIVGSVLFDITDPQAPVSPLYVAGKQQDFAFEKLDGRSADKRHHVRFWQVGRNDWLGAATYDRGVGFSLFTLQVTHHIAPRVDHDRTMVGAALIRQGARVGKDEDAHLGAAQRHRNGGGDLYLTDGHILRLVLPASSGCNKAS